MSRSQKASTRASSRAAHCGWRATPRRRRGWPPRSTRISAGRSTVSRRCRKPKQRNAFGWMACVSAYHNPHCARVQPARLVRGLADAAERLGVDVYEMSPATKIEAGRVTTPVGVVKAPIVLRATEGLHRRVAPAAAALAADEQLDDRHRSDPRRHLGLDRLARLRNPRGHRARLLLRTAHRTTTASRSAAAAFRTATVPAPTSTARCQSAPSGT